MYPKQAENGKRIAELEKSLTALEEELARVKAEPGQEEEREAWEVAAAETAQELEGLQAQVSGQQLHGVCTAVKLEFTVLARSAGHAVAVLGPDDEVFSESTVVVNGRCGVKELYLDVCNVKKRPSTMELSSYMPRLLKDRTNFQPIDSTLCDVRHIGNWAHVCGTCFWKSRSKAHVSGRADPIQLWPIFGRAGARGRLECQQASKQCDHTMAGTLASALLVSMQACVHSAWRRAPSTSSTSPSQILARTTCSSSSSDPEAVRLYG